MAEPSLQLGNGNWAVKSNNLLAYHKVVDNFYADELTFNRASSGTRVNEQGLIETASVISSTEEVINGDFATDITGWIQYASVSTWDNGTIKTTANSSNAYIRQNSILTNGKQFKVTFKAKASNISQSIVIYNGLAFVDTGLTFDVADTYQDFTYYLDQIGANIHLIVGQQSLSIGDSINFDNVSAKEVITANIARVDYTNNASGQLLFEPQRTNLLPQSSDFSTGWTKSSSTITSDAATSPSGDITADDLNIGTGGSLYYSGITVVQNTDYIFSFYVKDVNSTNNELAIYDESNASFIASDIAYSVTSEWTRVTYSFNTPTGCISARPYIQRAASGSGSVYIWGAMLEQSSYPTSYIPTSGTTVTRIKDTSVTTGLSSVINSQVGSITFNLSIVAEAAASYIDVSDGATNAFRVLFDGTNTTFRYYVAASLVAQTVEATPQENVDSVKTTYSNGDVRFYINDVLVGTHLAVGTLASNTLSVLDFSPTNFVLYGRIKSVILT